MLSENQRKKIDTILQEEINKSIMHDKIRKVVSEEVYRYINDLVTESDDISIKRKSVMNMLKEMYSVLPEKAKNTADVIFTHLCLIRFIKSDSTLNIINFALNYRKISSIYFGIY